MSNISEIIERLENIAKHAVHYVGEPPFIMSLDDGIALHEAIDLLKAQEPRVMTLHEIDDVINIASKEYKRIFWAEVRSKTRKSFGVFQLDIASEDCYEALLLGCSWPACYKRSTYGIRWRCWTSRPTDEQRQAVKWK